MQISHQTCMQAATFESCGARMNNGGTNLNIKLKIQDLLSRLPTGVLLLFFPVPFTFVTWNEVKGTAQNRVRGRALVEDLQYVPLGTKRNK